MKILLFLLLTTLALARPVVEVITIDDLTHLLWQYRRDTKSLRYLRSFDGKEFAELKTGDVFLWEEYRGQPLDEGDIVVFVYQGSKTARELAKVSTGSVRTVMGTTLQTTQLVGIVRRIIRIN